ncbi:MAG TPA: PBP1A family penicillin-binding protein [Blastocatellia bacterium]|nr:PBP1A family penicillin-binding protein [Blastocatellia bacterium]
MPDNFFLSSDDKSKQRRSAGGGFAQGLAAWVVRLEEFFRQATLLALLVLALIAGGLTGLVISYQASFSAFAAEVESLSDYRPAEVTRVYADDGKTVIGELALERRIPLSYEEIPERMKQAILAIEDQRFYSHIGIDPIRILGSLVTNVRSGRTVQGASTLTQQLARQLYLNNARTWTRKIKEILYALEIERYYTKDQIMALYCNQMFMGGGAYGIEAAANYYFSRPVKDLKLEEYAMLAALFKSAPVYSPVNHPKAALERRNLVLSAMADAGYISRAEAEEARSHPIRLDLNDARGRNDQSPYAYFVEEVRQELQRVMESNALDAMDVYRAGLSVYTTLDAQAQKDATEIVRNWLRRFDRRRGWRGELENVLQNEKIDLAKYRHPSWKFGNPDVGDILTGLVLEVDEKGAKVSFGNYSALVTAADTEWTGRPPAKLFKRGDLAQFAVKSVDEAKNTVGVQLEQEPEVQGGLVLIENKTGAIRAMFGGYNFATSKFNHATQAERQTGSVFKPFIYATAIEEGLKPDDPVDDAPFKRGDWTPHNYDDRFMGRMPIRKALALSRNIPAVRVLDEVGINPAQQMVRRLGLPNPMAPFLPSALGATEEPLLAMVSAYSTFPNGGVRVEPTRILKIVDRDGKVLQTAEPKSYKVLNEYVAATMVDLMREVVRAGTATAASGLAGGELAGKTGTVNDFTDAWFIGYTPMVTCGVWIGYPQKKSLGKGMSGAAAALPFWIEFMKRYLKDKPQGKFKPVPKVPDEVREKQNMRARDRAALLARSEAGQGKSILPAEQDIPDLDPLGREEARPKPEPEKVPQITVPAVKPPAPETRPKVVTPKPEPKPPVEDSGRRGKKGKPNEP